MIKNPPVMWEIWVDPSFGKIPWRRNGYPLQYLAWRILWTEEPGRLQSMGSQRIGWD